jgi:HD domain
MATQEFSAEVIAGARREAARWLDVPQFRDRRWRHVQAVGAKAERLAPAYGADGQLLVCAAWLHDIGYAPGLQVRGFHPLDGARHLLETGSARQRLAGLVANHSGAAVEAELRGLSAEMSAFPDEASGARDALWACDMTTSPTGEPVGFDDRLAEIIQRYGPEHTVPQAIGAASGEIRAAIQRTRQQAAAHGLGF